jgi:hypothetical protein
MYSSKNFNTWIPGWISPAMKLMAEKDTTASNFKLRSTSFSVSTHEKLLTRYKTFLLFKGLRSFKELEIPTYFIFYFVHLAPAPQTQLLFSYWPLILVGWPISRRPIRRPITDLLIRLFDLSRPLHEDIQSPAFFLTRLTNHSGDSY